MADSDFPFYRPGRTFYDDDMSRASSYVKRKRKVDNDKFALGRRGILVFFTLSVLTLMAALDGTSLSVALPVSASASGSMYSSLPALGTCKRTQWNGHRGILEWNFVPVVLNR
jgi:hypothetical protein